MDRSSFELPVGSKVQLLQEYSLTVANVAQIHETTVNVSDIPHLFIPKELVIRITVIIRIVFNLPILILGLVLVDLILLDLKVISLGLYLLVLFFSPKYIYSYIL